MSHNKNLNQSEIIENVRRLIKDFLDQEPEVDENILEIDGNSIMLVRLADSISQCYGISFAAVDFFMAPTVLSISEVIRSRLNKTG